MITTSLKLSALAAVFILAGCGGGSSTTKSTTQTSKISGTVPGTLIEAFCADGSYYKVTSTNNNTNEHPFEIEIPSTVSCSLVMTTNENDEAKKVITQIGVITADAKGTVFTATGDINLGYIPLAMDPSDINDENGDHVSDDILSIQVDGELIVVELENPLDDDNDGLVNVYEDDDNDGIYNHDDSSDEKDSDDEDSSDEDSGEKDSDDGTDVKYTNEKDSDDEDSSDEDSGEKDSADSTDVKYTNEKDSDDEDSSDEDSGVNESADEDSDEKDSDDEDASDEDASDEDSGEKDSNDEDFDEKDSDDENASDEDLSDEDSGEKDSDDEDSSDHGTADILLPTTYTVNEGRLLGSQCAQCHGTNGISSNNWDSIAGEDNLEDEIYEDDEPIMTAQAHGYTSEEIILIGDWLKTLKTND